MNSVLDNYTAILEEVGFENVGEIKWNLSPEELVEETIKRNMGVLADTGAICIETGKFTGRSPKDRFIVLDDETRDTVDWNHINQPFEIEKFEGLEQKIKAYFEGKDIFVRDAFACADPTYRLKLRLFSEYPWSNQFAGNMFIRPEAKDLENFDPDWKIICAPGFEANPVVDGTNRGNFSIINISKKLILIGGSGYTGEIKKGIFSVLNYLLPTVHGVMPMHCSANRGKEGDVALFFGLSGTGKTTLSADPARDLIGDDEHGWSDHGVFNFEGGCYAKCIDLTAEKEPEIFKAIRHGAILENIRFFPGTRTVDYSNISLTENTRVSYPIHHIDNALIPSVGEQPKHVFFLTCDAWGVLPPISKLTPGQAMFHFLSGYTAKVAGTEEGVTEPKETFSACFGAPFMPLHPTQYAEMLGDRMQKSNTSIWLINTGWTGGAYGSGSRIKLRYTRAMITAAMTGQLASVGFTEHEIFGVAYPDSVPDVPSEILNPKNTWSDKTAYDHQAAALSKNFNKNFQKFADKANQDILDAAPRII
ncbi:MAG: phosphoenolpyruvate carboxykinase (ATP) [Saprospiraceae bacterium]|nr:phosphoenolpyruvate carboxykinase (ATP) [Saprospiraceae bacterium]